MQQSALEGFKSIIFSGSYFALLFGALFGVTRNAGRRSALETATPGVKTLNGCRRTNFNFLQKRLLCPVLVGLCAKEFLYGI